MKIVIDELPLHSGHAARGMGVYTRRLIESLEKELTSKREISLDTFVFSENRGRLAEYDIVHYPYFDIFYHTLPLRKDTKTVVTVPDVTPLLYPEYYPPGIKGRLNFILQKRALSNVNAVVTISETSKKDIVRFLDIPSKKVFVTKLAGNFSTKRVSTSQLSKISRKYNLPKEFILYIGDVNWNKNLLRLIKAVKRIDETLVIVGKSAVRDEYDKDHIENKPLREIQERYGNDKQVMRLGFVEDNDLNAIWQLATVYCMPSLYEGFGLSVVEAMEAGVPVVCSRTQVLVEVAGDSAVYFDPYSENDIAEKLKYVMSNKKIQKDLVSKGFFRAKKYSWQKTALETIKVYEKLR